MKMTFASVENGIVQRDFSEHKNVCRGPKDLPFSLRETPSNSCRWSTSNSTATPSEAESSHGDASPRQLESVEELDPLHPVEARVNAKPIQTDARDEGLNRLVRPEMEEAPLGDMFDDSDDDMCPISPSKSAKRRMRRRRQRDALKAAITQQAGELEVLEARRRDSKEHKSSRSIVTLDDIGFELNGSRATAEETPQTKLVTTPMHRAPCTPGVLSTNPGSESPAIATSSSIFRTALLCDASNRHLPSMNQYDPRGQTYWNPSPCASSRVAPGSTRTSPNATILLNATTTQPLASGVVASSPFSPSMCPVAAIMPAPASVDSWKPYPLGQSRADTLRMLFGSSTVPSEGDIVATLKAAAPEVYED